jgi:hypothetical protein
MLSVVMPSVVMLSVVMLSVVILSFVMLSVVMLSVVMLNVVMLSVVMLNVMAPSECRFSVSFSLSDVVFTSAITSVLHDICSTRHFIQGILTEVDG